MLFAGLCLSFLAWGIALLWPIIKRLVFSNDYSSWIFSSWTRVACNAAVCRSCNTSSGRSEALCFETDCIWNFASFCTISSTFLHPDICPATFPFPHSWWQAYAVLLCDFCNRSQSEPAWGLPVGRFQQHAYLYFPYTISSLMQSSWWILLEPTTK